MATIKRFEDIVAWQKAIELNDLLYDVAERSPFSKDFTLKNQMQKCALSVSSNIAEGFERESINSFIYFLLIAKGSCGEFRSQLYVAKNRRYISEEEFKNIYAQAEELSKMISGFVKYLRTQKLKNVLKTAKSILTFNLL
jgi:four helix bundle protein